MTNWSAPHSSLERLTADVQEIEFTIQDGTLWLLQTRAAKRSAQAAVRLALQLLNDGLIDEAETLRRVTPAHVEALLQPSLQPENRLTADLLATGLPAGPGVASGRAYTDVDAAIDAADRGEDVILVRNHTSPNDIHGMLVARGIVTETGGATSHAAVVSRELGRVAVVGCGGGAAESLAGKLVTVDGNTGEVREGSLRVVRVVGDQHSRAASNWLTSPGGSVRCGRIPAATTRGWIAIPRPRCASPWPAGTATWCPPARCWRCWRRSVCHREPTRCAAGGPAQGSRQPRRSGRDAGWRR